jgi:hypothetical protein
LVTLFFTLADFFTLATNFGDFFLLWQLFLL